MEGPAWATWVGTIAVILGFYLASAYGVEAAKQYTLHAESVAEFATLWECPEDELIEENVSLQACEGMAERVEAIIEVRPDWFRGFHMAVGIGGALLALVSIFVATGLIDWRPWAPSAFIAVTGALAVLDLAVFIATANSDPVLRDEYLWNSLLWFLIHSGLMAATIAGKQENVHD
ncbi:MAG: hypothetical protein ACREV9_11135 [Burkholderiales bacterium]